MRIDELIPWQCPVLYLISIQERANINCIWYLIQNQLKNKQAKGIYNLFSDKTLSNILMFKARQMFSKCFYDNTIKVFSYSLNIVVILAPAHEFLSAKCTQFPLSFMEWIKWRISFL